MPAPVRRRDDIDTARHLKDMLILIMALLSRSCVYGLRAVILMAMRGEAGAYLPIRVIADELEISFHFLTKILQSLTEAGLLKSYRGPSGGVALVRPAGEITLLDIVRSLDGEALFRGCALGLAQCSDASPCPLHEAWCRRREDLVRLFDGATLAELASRTAAHRFRLKDLIPSAARRARA